MKISVRNLEPTKVKLTVTVEPEELNPYLDAARKEIAKQVNVPGFRKGHVPGKIIDQRIGFAAVAGEAVNDAVPELYSKALDEKKIRPMAQPEFDVQDVPQSANDETKLKFTATVERRPDIELPEIDGLEIAISKPEVKDEDVDKRLETLRQRFGTLVGVDRPAAKGDFANIDLTAEIDGETVDSQEGVSYELGSNTMLDGLDEALDGLSAGEETTFEGTLEAGEHEGQKATVKVKVNSVKAEELPELNDEFASEASEFDTLDELKADIRKAAAQDAEGRQATEARDAFIAKLQEGLEIPVPKGVKANMVEEQLKGMTPDPEKATKEQKAQAEETVEKDLRDQMVLDALAEKLDVQVSQSDVFNFLASIAQQYGMDPNNFIQAIIKNGQLGSAVQEVGRSKGLLAGMRAVKFTADGEVVDLSAFLGEAAEDEESESVEAASAAAAVADELSAKEYQKLLKGRTLNYVIMFIPVESAYVAALEADNNLYDYAYRRNVILATPLSLMPVLRTVENLWRIDSQNQNVQKIAELGGKIYDKLAAFVEDMKAIERGLNQASNAYNNAMTKLSGRGSALSQAENMKKIGRASCRERV